MTQDARSSETDNSERQWSIADLPLEGIEDGCRDTITCVLQCDNRIQFCLDQNVGQVMRHIICVLRRQIANVGRIRRQINKLTNNQNTSRTELVQLAEAFNDVRRNGASGNHRNASEPRTANLPYRLKLSGRQSYTSINTESFQSTNLSSPGTHPITPELVESEVDSGVWDVVEQVSASSRPSADLQERLRMIERDNVDNVNYLLGRVERCDNYLHSLSARTDTLKERLELLERSGANTDMPLTPPEFHQILDHLSIVNAALDENLRILRCVETFVSSSGEAINTLQNQLSTTTSLESAMEQRAENIRTELCSRIIDLEAEVRASKRQMEEDIKANTSLLQNEMCSWFTSHNSRMETETLQPLRLSLHECHSKIDDSGLSHNMQAEYQNWRNQFETLRTNIDTHFAGLEEKNTNWTSQLEQFTKDSMAGFERKAQLGLARVEQSASDMTRWRENQLAQLVANLERNVEHLQQASGNNTTETAQAMEGLRLVHNNFAALDQRIDEINQKMQEMETVPADQRVSERLYEPMEQDNDGISRARVVDFQGFARCLGRGRHEGRDLRGRCTELLPLEPNETEELVSWRCGRCRQWPP